MNKTYRLIWNELSHSWVPAPEGARARGKRTGGALRLLALSAALLASGIAQAQAPALPSGGQIVAGSGSIAQSGNTLTITQTSDKLATNWQSFSIGAGQSVNFVQPGSGAIALNRVLGAGVSTIQGALNANGQVFLINPNGVLFTATAQVNVGGLVASTLNLSDADFLAGRYRFSGDSAASVVNAGHIQAGAGGNVALIAARISNSGSIATGDGGRVQLGAGRRVLLDLGGPAKLEIEEGALDALIEQGGAIRADGGLIYLTAKSAGEIAGSVIKHTGTSEARTLASGAKGEIYLLGDLGRDSIQVGGTLDASAPLGGDGGFIETSAAKVGLSAGRKITTLASSGRTGTWLIDPNDFTIAASGGDISGAQLSADLVGTNMTIATTNRGTAGGNGDIFVNDSISWGSNNTLTLKAERDILINQQIRHAAGTGDLILRSDSDANGTGAVKFADANTRYIDFSGSDGNIKLYYNPTGSGVAKYRAPTSFDKNIAMGGGALSPYMLVNNGQDLVDFVNSTSGGPLFVFAALGRDIDPGAGNNLGELRGSTFRGVFDGDGHTISNMKIGGGGMWSYLIGAVLKNITLDASNIIAFGSQRSGGAFADRAYSSVFENLVNRANVTFAASTSYNWGGGLVNEFTDGVMINVENHGTIFAGNNTQMAGGIAGRIGNSSLYRVRNYGDIVAGSALPAADARSHYVGGIAGWSYNSKLVDVQNRGRITAFLAHSSPNTDSIAIGGIIGLSGGDTISMAEQRGDINVTAAGRIYVGGITGLASGGQPAQLTDLYSSGNFNVSVQRAASGDSNLFVGGLLGALSTSNAAAKKNLLANAITEFSLNLSNDAALPIPEARIFTSGAVAMVSGYTEMRDTYWNASGTALKYPSAPYTGSQPALLTASNIGAKSTADLRDTANYGPSWSNWLFDYAGAGQPLGGVPALKQVLIAYSEPMVKHYDGQAYSAAAAAAHIKVAGGTLSDVTGSATVTGSYVGATQANAWTDWTSQTYSARVDGLSAKDGDTQVLVNAGNLFVIKPRLITVTPDNVSKFYGDADALSWQLSSGQMLGTDTLSGRLSRTPGENSATYSINANNMTVGSNYYLTKGTGTLTIKQRPITVTVDDKTKVYGDADPSLTWQLTGGSMVGSDTLTGSLSRSVGENVGSYAIGRGTLANGNYAITVQNGTLTLNPRPITVTADNANKIYGEADPTLGWRITGGKLVGNDSLNGALTRAIGNNVGSYKIDASALANGNYVISVIDGSLSITPRAITVTADNANKIYGEADPTLSWRITGGKLVGNDSLNGALTRAIGNNVGSYKIDASALANGNYAISVVDGALTITPRAITVSADNASKIYGDADPTLGWRVTAGKLVGNDSLSGALTRAAGSNVGSYKIDVSALANDNYAISVVDGALSITPRAITVAADNASKVYGDADPMLGYRITSGNLVGSDSLSGALTRAAGSNVGSYKIDASALANGNYAISVVDGALTITPRAITVAADNASKIYGDADPTLGWRVTAGKLVGSDSLSGALTRAAGSNVGSYKIDASALANGNYAITLVDGALTITPRAITVAADNASKIYGDADPTLGYRITSGKLVGSDSLSGALTRAAGSNVGSYKIDASALANGNYAISVVDGALTITPRAITVAADNASKIYGDADPTLGYRVTAGKLVGNDSLSGALTRAAGEGVGSYTISAAQLANGNYLVTALDGTLSIVAAPNPAPGISPPALETAQSSASRQAAVPVTQYSAAASSRPQLQDNSSLNLVPVSGDTLAAALASSGNGRDVAGALRVLVVDGGLRLSGATPAAARIE